MKAGWNKSKVNLVATRIKGETQFKGVLMAKVVIFGGSGYTGTNLSRELIARGHEVVAISRDTSKPKVDGVNSLSGDITDLNFVAQALEGASDVVLAVRHSDPVVADIVDQILDLATKAGIRLGVVGGAGSLLVSEDGPRLIDTPDFPDIYKGEALAAADTLEKLKSSQGGDWYYVSPPAGYGSYAPGEKSGKYRLGGDVLLVDAAGNSLISGDDFAIALADEIEEKNHRNTRFTVASQ